MSEELGVRSEELIQMLRGCASGSSEFCESCKFRDYHYCGRFLTAAAADEIERLSEELSANEYQKLAMRTANTKCFNLANAGLGLTGEAGEAADLIKKHLYHGHDLDKDALAKELGDVLWYVALTASLIGKTMSEIMQENIFKLRKRYPEGFDPERSVHRAES